MLRQPIDRFVEKYVVDDDGCWIWTAASVPAGYGCFWDGQRQVYAHRWSYEYHIGPIPDGLHIDHLCRVHSCVNPDHLEPVTCRENLLRGVGPTATNAAKTHCPQGHPYDEINTYRNPNTGQRMCRLCQRALDKKRVRRAATA